MAGKRPGTGTRSAGTPRSSDRKGTAIAMASQELDFTLVEFEDAWPAVSDEWFQLFGECEDPCTAYHPVFLFAAETLRGRTRPSHLVLGRQAGRLVLGLPARIEERWPGVRELRFYAPPYLNHLAPLDATPGRRATAALLRHAHRHIGVATWRVTEAAPGLLAAVGEPAEGRPRLSVHLLESHCPVLHVPEDATDVTAALTNARLRSEIRRHWRRAEAQGITARVVTTDSTEYSLRQALDHLTHLHVLRRDSLGKSSTWSPSVQAFHARACEAAQQYPGCLSFAELLHEGRVIASSYGVRSPVRFCGVQAGWDPVYANCAPMTLLIQQTIAWLATERTPYLCFGSGSATHSYKDRWTETNTHDVALFAVCSPAGRAVTRLARLRHLVRQNGPAQGALLWLTGPDGDPEAVADARHAPAGSTPPNR